MPLIIEEENPTNEEILFQYNWEIEPKLAEMFTFHNEHLNIYNFKKLERIVDS